MGKKSYEETAVAVEKSKGQIEKLLKEFNVIATRFTSYPSYAQLEFVRKAGSSTIPYRVVVKPKVNTLAFNTGRELDRAERQVWRVVYWWLKSKLEAISFGLVEFEQEMLPYMLLQGQGKSQTAAEVFFERLAGAIGPPGDPFGGLHPALPPGKNDQDYDQAG